MENINVIITAGGKSTRYGKNKLFEPCKTSCVLLEAIKPFLAINEVNKIIVPIDPHSSNELLNYIDTLKLDEDHRIVLTRNGDTRTKSVWEGLQALDEDCSLVLIHDGARPFVSTRIINEVIDGAKELGAAVPIVDMLDSIIKVEDNLKIVDRNNYKRVQTPQGFKKDIIVEAYNRAKKDYSDDLSLVKAEINTDCKLVDGDLQNIKITTKGDLFPALVGGAYDIHTMESGKGITLGGVNIPCDFKLIAHSDGDVVLHALMDAMLTAIGEKDIGHLFPVDDKAYDNIESTKLIKQVIGIIKDRGYKVSNATISIICEKPKLQPYIDQMKISLASLFDILSNKIGISATTNEKTGLIGEGKAIAAFANVLLEAI